MRNNQRIEEEFNDSLGFDEIEDFYLIDSDLEPYEDTCPVCGHVRDLGETCRGCGVGDDPDEPYDWNPCHTYNTNA